MTLSIERLHALARGALPMFHEVAPMASELLDRRDKMATVAMKADAWQRGRHSWQVYSVMNSVINWKEIS